MVHDAPDGAPGYGGESDALELVNAFPSQPLDFFGAVRIQMRRRRRPSLHRARGAREPRRHAVRSSRREGGDPGWSASTPTGMDASPFGLQLEAGAIAPGAAERGWTWAPAGSTSPTGRRDRAPRRYARDDRWSARWRTPTRRRWRLRRRRGSRRSGRGAEEAAARSRSAEAEPRRRTPAAR